MAGAIHFIRHFIPAESRRAALTTLMKSYHPPGVGFSQWDVQEAFTIGFGFLTVWVGVSGLLFARFFAESPERLRTAALLYAIAAAGLIVIVLRYGIAIPAISLAPSLAFFVMAYFATPHTVETTIRRSANESR